MPEFSRCPQCGLDRVAVDRTEEATVWECRCCGLSREVIEGDMW